MSAVQSKRSFSAQDQEGRRGPASHVSTVADLASFARLLRGEGGGQSAPAQAREQHSGSRRDYEAAFALVTKACEAIDALQERCKRSEASASEIAAWAEREIASANTSANQWQRVAADLQVRLEDCEKQLAVQIDRAGNAERRAAIDAELSTRLHDRIVAAFGQYANDYADHQAASRD